VAGPDGGMVLTFGDVADPVQRVLDRPVRADPAGQQLRVGGPVVQGGERVDGLHRRARLAGGPAPADDLDRSGAVRESLGFRCAVQVDDLDRAGLDPAVSDVALEQSGCLSPGQPGQGLAQERLVALDGEQVVRAPAVQVVRVRALAVQRVRGDQDTVQLRQVSSAGTNAASSSPPITSVWVRTSRSA
jgi:hypothetical protein